MVRGSHGSHWSRRGAQGSAENGRSPENGGDRQTQDKFDQTTYDFGKTSQVEHVSGTFIFHNVGDADLKIGKPSTSCGCTVAGVKPEALKPGEQGELNFTLNLGRNRAVLQKQITVESNDPESPKTLLQSRRITPPSTKSPPSVTTSICAKARRPT